MAFSTGEVVGPYQIVQCIGQGGMATIYKARQVALDRYVALKVIHPALKDDPSFLMRLSREATILGRLNHPNIVPVYDFGECDGIPYLVMRFIDGRSLKTVMQESHLDVQDILSIARCIGNALEYAHEHGVLHRDVKPSNVLLDSEDNVYLTDFGLARLIHSGETTLSRDMLIGSPLYISPEQARGNPVDERADVYSFGVVLYEMFTGRVPFAADTTYATIMAQINDPPPSPRSINPRIPRAVEAVLQKALSKDAKDRYASPLELVYALENAALGPSHNSRYETLPVVMSPVGASVGRAKRSTASAPRTASAPNQGSSCLGKLVVFIVFLLALYAVAGCVIAAGLAIDWQQFASALSALIGP